MRPTPIAALAAAAALAAGAGCFNPEIGNTPFLCAPSGKKCPDGYHCESLGGTPGQGTAATGVCVKDGFKRDGSVARDQGPVARDIRPSKETAIVLDGWGVRSSKGCADADSEPNNSTSTATDLSGQIGTIPGWEICYPGDIDFYSLQVKAGQKIEVKVIFSHDKGDLDAILVNPDLFIVSEGRSTTSNETVSASAGRSGKWYIAVFGFGRAKNTYSLDISIN